MAYRTHGDRAEAWVVPYEFRALPNTAPDGWSRVLFNSHVETNAQQRRYAVTREQYVQPWTN